MGRDYGSNSPGWDAYYRSGCAGFVIACQSDQDSQWGSLVSGIGKGWKAADGSAVPANWYMNSFDDTQWSPPIAAATRGCAGCLSTNGTAPAGIWANVPGHSVPGSCHTDADAAFRIAIHTP